ncbi:MAG: replication initiation protein [Treponema sp.]|nr:replication initiation protein [Treponema sp.]
MDDLNKIRNYKVVKANELIQKSRFDLNLQEQKIILYIISKIKPADLEFEEYSFSIQDFCEVCGFDNTSGKNYENIKKSLQDLRNKSVWIQINDKRQTTLAWFDKVTIDRGSGVVTLKIDDHMKPYLLALKSNFTQYELFYTLAMKSRYSIRLYELLKSHEFRINKIFGVDELKVLLSAEKYERFPDFKRRVLDIAVKEINEVSDLNAEYEIIKKGRKSDNIDFEIRLKVETNERISTWKKISGIID